LRAKFEDATYFYEHDLRVSLEKRLEQLKGLVYHAGMGTIYDKAQRLCALAGYIAEKLCSDSQTKAAAERAALLCKADLVTDLVVEITSLQGVMGREYALVAGESAEVAEAIGEHYRPRFAGDKLPQSPVGRIVALADKLDTIVTGLAAGLAVTGSADPYGLRREGQGIVALLVEGKLSLSLRDMIARSLELLRAQQEVKRQPEEVEKSVADLLKQRIERLLEDNPPLGKGLRYDLTDAALGVGADDCAEAIARAEALKKLARRADFLPTVVAATRPANIVKGFAGGEPDPALFTAPTEKLLWDQCLAAQPKIEELAKKGDYLGLFEVLASLRKTIDRFFDDVLVMDKDERIKQNRLALVWQIDRLFRHLADFRLVVQE
jgi:glycyl-tRNA synthetase beta chain